MATALLPLTVTEHKRPRTGETSWRVVGWLEGKRMRKQFADPAAAQHWCNEKNLEASGATPKSSVVLLQQTRLTADQIAAAEAAFGRIGDRPLSVVVDAGLAALARVNAAEPLAPLFAEWLALVKKEVGKRWYAQMRLIGLDYLKAYPDATTAQLTRASVRAWLDQRGGAAQTRRNRRNALHRFGAWLVERGHAQENPVSEIRIGRSKKEKEEHGAASVFSAMQARAWLEALKSPDCRRLTGWVGLCLFAGLRPNSEAVRLTWAEVNFQTGEISVMGTKRGARPRHVAMNTLARTMLQRAKDDGEARPGYFARLAFRTAIDRANAWLAEHAAGTPLIDWQQDMQRHTYASMRAGQGVHVEDLAYEMGTSAKTIYAHYRNPRPAAEVAAFWALTP